ncbi:MAG: hypothetical protein QM784_05070 [Polyangiaceae bacterium]
MTPTDLQPIRAGQILLIDDEAAVRVVTNRLLVDFGQRVLTADSGRKGLEIFREHYAKIDLVLARSDHAGNVWCRGAGGLTEHSSRRIRGRHEWISSVERV